MTAEDRQTTSHWAVHEHYCRLMAKKYGWTLLEARRRIEARDPLVVECIFEGDAEFPKSFIDYGADDS